MKAALSMLAMCATLATAALAAPAARAERGDDNQAKARAQVLLSDGTAAYGRGDYATALDRFTAAYQIFPSPKLWFNIGQANRDLGRPVDAVAAFDRFLKEAGDAPPETLAEARRSAAELKAKLGQIEVACATDGAEVTVDGKPVGSTPLGQMVWTTPGRHQVAVQQPGFSPAIEDVVVAAGNVTGISIDLRPVDLRPANPTGDAALLGAGPAADEQPIYRRVWFWVAVSAVVAAGVTTAVILATRHAGTGLPDTTLGAQRTF
jgi:hypothetical protein